MSSDAMGATAQTHLIQRACLVCLVVALVLLCAVSELLAPTAKGQTPQATPPNVPTRQDAARPPGGEQNQAAPLPLTSLVIYYGA
jgi:hypothetical protein